MRKRSKTLASIENLKAQVTEVAMQVDSDTSEPWMHLEAEIPSQTLDLKTLPKARVCLGASVRQYSRLYEVIS